MRRTSVTDEATEEAGEGGEMEAEGRPSPFPPLPLRPLLRAFVLYSEFFNTFRGDCGDDEERSTK